MDVKIRDDSIRRYHVFLPIAAAANRKYIIQPWPHLKQNCKIGIKHAKRCYASCNKLGGVYETGTIPRLIETSKHKKPHTRTGTCIPSCLFWFELSSFGTERAEERKTLSCAEEYKHQHRPLSRCDTPWQNAPRRNNQRARPGKSLITPGGNRVAS